MDRCTTGRRKIVIIYSGISSCREFYSLQTRIFCNNFKPSLDLQKLSVMKQGGSRNVERKNIEKEKCRKERREKCRKEKCRKEKCRKGKISKGKNIEREKCRKHIY